MTLYRIQVGNNRPVYGSKALIIYEVVEALEFIKAPPSQIKLSTILNNGKQLPADDLRDVIIKNHTNGVGNPWS